MIPLKPEFPVSVEVSVFCDRFDEDVLEWFRMLEGSSERRNTRLRVGANLRLEANRIAVTVFR
jgi:hypothetical protein